MLLLVYSIISLAMSTLQIESYNSEEDVSHLYRWRFPNLLTGGEHISPASCDAKLVPVGKRQEEVLPAAKLEQRRYKVIPIFNVLQYVLHYVNQSGKMTAWKQYFRVVAYNGMMKKI